MRPSRYRMGGRYRWSGIGFEMRRERLFGTKSEPMRTEGLFISYLRG